MSVTASIRFNAALVQSLANKRWPIRTITRWADAAHCSERTLRQFLAGDDRIKISTIDAICRPFKMKAADIQLPSND